MQWNCGSEKMSNLKNKTYKSLSKPLQVSGTSKPAARRKNTNAISIPSKPSISSFPVGDVVFRGSDELQASFPTVKFIDFVNHWLKVDAIDANLNFKARIEDISELKYSQDKKSDRMVILLNFRTPIEFISNDKSFPAFSLALSLHKFDNHSLRQISKELKLIIGSSCKYIRFTPLERVSVFPFLFTDESNSRFSLGKNNINPSDRTTRSTKSGVTMIYENEDLLEEKLDNLMIAENGSTQYEDIPQEDQIYFYPKLKISFNDKSHFTISNNDFKCLYNGNWINDSIVDFFIHMNYQESKYLKSNDDNTRPTSENVDDDNTTNTTNNNDNNDTPKLKIEILNSFFYTSLSRSVKDGDYYKNVKSWFKNKNDLFKNDYVVIPIMQDLHWYAVILKNLKNLVNGSQDSATYIYFIDSLKKRHNICGKILKSFIDGYAKTKHPDVEVDLSKIIENDASVPKQNNFNDCGIHVISNIKLFLNDPEQFDQLILKMKSTEEERDHFFATDDRYQMRNSLRDKLLNLLKYQILDSGNHSDLINFGLTYSQLEKIGHNTETIEHEPLQELEEEEDDDLVIVNVIKKDNDIDPNNIIDLQSPRKKPGRRKKIKPLPQSNNYLVTLKSKNNQKEDIGLEGSYKRKDVDAKEHKFRQKLTALNNQISPQKVTTEANSLSETKENNNDDEEEVAEIKSDINLLSNTQTAQFRQPKYNHDEDYEELSQDSLTDSPIKLTEHEHIPHTKNNNLLLDIQLNHGKNKSPFDPEYHPETPSKRQITENSMEKKEILRKSRSADVIEVVPVLPDDTLLTRRIFPNFDSKTKIPKKVVSPSVINDTVNQPLKRNSNLRIKKVKDVVREPKKIANHPVKSGVVVSAIGGTVPKITKSSYPIVQNQSTKPEALKSILPPLLPKLSDSAKGKSRSTPIEIPHVMNHLNKKEMSPHTVVKPVKKSGYYPSSSALNKLKKQLFVSNFDLPTVSNVNRGKRTSSSIELTTENYVKHTESKNQKYVPYYQVPGDVNQQSNELVSDIKLKKPTVNLKSTTNSANPKAFQTGLNYLLNPILSHDATAVSTPVAAPKFTSAVEKLKEFKPVHHKISKRSLIDVTPKKSIEIEAIDEPIILVSPEKIKREPSIIELSSNDNPQLKMRPKDNPESHIVIIENDNEPKKFANRGRGENAILNDYKLQQSKSKTDKTKNIEIVKSKKVLSPTRKSNNLSDSSPIKLTDDAPSGSNKDNAIVIAGKSSLNLKHSPPQRRKLRSSPPGEPLNKPLTFETKHQKKKGLKRNFIDIESDNENSNREGSQINKSQFESTSKGLFQLKKIRSNARTKTTSRYRIQNIFEDDEEPSPEFEIF